MKLGSATPATMALVGALLVYAAPHAVLGQEPVRPVGGAAACSRALQAPAQRGDEWETGTLEAESLAVEPLVSLLEAICSDSFGDIHSVLLARRGRLVFEAYFPGYAWSYEAQEFRGAATDFGPETRDNMQSVSKSVTGLLVGIARDRGYLPDLTASVFSFFPEYSRFAEGAKSGITLQSLLLMASGLRWNEQDVFYGQPTNDIVQLHVADDPIAYVLSKDLTHPPMTEWYYNGGGVVLVGEIVRRTSGHRLDEFAAQHLFGPLGITGAKWSLVRSGVVDAPGGLDLRPRDMAKLGQVVLNGGTWRGRRIVSEDWINMMTNRHVRFNATDGYGYYWWAKTYVTESDSIPSVRADGWGGQRIMVFPTLDLVAVFTGGNYTISRPPRLDEIVSRFIIPAARTKRK
jgi:CubicO group peptidase (beta-lactamase class C family)